MIIDGQDDNVARMEGGWCQVGSVTVGEAPPLLSPPDDPPADHYPLIVTINWPSFVPDLAAPPAPSRLTSR